MLVEGEIPVDSGRLAAADAATPDRRVEWAAGGDGGFGVFSVGRAACVLPPAWEVGSDPSVLVGELEVASGRLAVWDPRSRGGVLGGVVVPLRPGRYTVRVLRDADGWAAAWIEPETDEDARPGGRDEG